jgi:2-amino-4-hydroxy-6-hydroxymethyldihydropteridine diphosphokinase
MAKILLGLGSNVNRIPSIQTGLELLQKAFGSIEKSPTFESEAVGFDGNNFYNLVVSTTTDLGLAEVRKIYQAIEDTCGRDRSGPKFGPRTLDIDLLTYGDMICDEPLELPRGEILENAFVLWPLALLAPDDIHPRTLKTYRQHWEEYDNNQNLWQIETPWD